MIVTEYPTREEWLSGRVNKVTGTKLKDLISKKGGKKIGYYQLIADRLAVEPDDENPMERGQRLESESLARFSEITGKELDTRLIICSREDNESIAYSPDALVVGEHAAVETKSLSSARHIEAWLTQEIPSEYEEQALQPFIVDDTLETLYFCFYDPRIPCKPFFWVEMNRETVKEKVAEYLKYEQDTLAEINDIVATLSNF